MSTDGPLDTTSGRPADEARAVHPGPPTQQSPPERRGQQVRRLRRRVVRLAEQQAGVVSRRQLRRAGVPRWVLQLEIRAGRWQRTGRQSVVIHNGPLDDAARRAIAVAEVCSRAALDGVSALQQHGITSLRDERVTVIAPKSSDPRRLARVRVYESRRFRAEDVEVVDGVRTTRPAVAAVHAALWAATDRQATLFLVLAVQQLLTDVAELAEVVGTVRRHPRRRLLHLVLADLTGGVRSMGELDVARAMRQRGLPEPDRQVLRRRPSGEQYLDARFDRYGVTMEIDGQQHDAVEHRVADVLRDFTLAAEGDLVLRLPLVVWRLAEQEVLDRLEQVLRARGWGPSAA